MPGARSVSWTTVWAAAPAGWIASVLICALFAVANTQAHAQTTLPAKRVAIDILTEKPVVEPGEEIWIALRERIEPGWHTYWTNPGDSGEPTTLTWHLPAGFTAGPVLFPIPSAIPVGPLVNYGYSDEVLLLSRLKIPAALKDARNGQVEITAKAEWLVCKDICIPESGEARLTLKIANAGVSTAPGPGAPRLAAAVAALPAPSPWPARFAVGTDTIDLTFSGLGRGRDRPLAVTIFPETWGQVNHAGAQALSWSGDDLTVRLERGDLKKETLTGLAGLLVVEEGAPRSRRGYTMAAGTIPPKAAPPAGTAPASQAPVNETGFFKALLFAILGGLILNLMPCVFPVLSLKAVALAQGDRPPSERRADGLAYLAGVLASFALLALALLALRHAGQSFGWGFQFQSPVFVLLMAGVFFLLGLALSGVLNVGATLTGAGSTLADKSGPWGTFFTGALATIAATPCTAPFMGAAIGYALTASAFTGFLVLMAMGLGFAAPVVALAVAPNLRRVLPKPGRWMETFKQVMAFPLYASAAWMVWVLSVQLGSDGVLAAMVLLVGLGFLAWVWSWMQGRDLTRYAMLVALAAVVVTGLAAAMLDTTAPPPPGIAAAAPKTDVTGLPIIPFSTARIAALQQEGRPVFVNVTAAWCITCKVNERAALSSDRMRAAFSSGKVAYVKGDWTRQDPEITRFLQSFGRAGVPLYLLYPAKPGAPPRVLDQILTESGVLAELQTAAAAR